MKQYNNITVLKGIACVELMIGHFMGIIKYTDEKIFNNPFCVFLEKDFILFNEFFWLPLFFIASGFLLAHSNVKTFRDLIEKSIFRFIRLGLPVLFSSLIVWLIYITIGFKNGETAMLFANDWYQSAYQSQDHVLLTALFSPITVLLLGRSPLNSPFWVLKGMFIASVGIYIHKYILNILKEKYRCNTAVIWLFNIIYLCAALKLNTVIAHIILGEFMLLYAVPAYKTLKNKMQYLNVIAAAMALAALLAFKATDQSLCSVVFFALIILISMDCTISPKSKLLYLGNISFGIYALHWPIICSVGSQLILHLTQYTIFSRILMSIVFCIVISIIAAVLFHNTFEKISAKILNRIKRYTCCVQRTK